MARLKLKDLKRSCIMRGIPFPRVIRYDVHGLQSWLFKNFQTRINPMRLEEYDLWFDQQLTKSGPVPLALRLSYFGEDDDGNRKSGKRDMFMLGVEKTKAEIAGFRPKRGSMKEMVFSLIKDGVSTKDTIFEVQDLYPGANEGSIKSWASKARKAKRYQEELDNE